METVQELEGSAATLRTLAHLRRTKLVVERDILRAAVRYAEIRNGETVRGARPDGRVMPGMERSVTLGGPGTPEVGEFAVADVAAELETSPYAARLLMADGLDLQHRHPRLWARVNGCEVPVWAARKVAAATRGLSAEGATLVDGRVAPYADGRLSWARFSSVLEAAVIDADPDAAAERERRAAEDKFAKVGRSNDHGQKTLYVRDHAASIIRLDATIAFIAEALRAMGDPDDEDARRVKALAVMANPLQAVQLLAAYQAGYGHASRGDQDPPLFDSSEVGDEPDTGPARRPAGSAGAGDQSPFTKPEPFRPSDIPCCPHTELELRGRTGAGFAVDWSKLLPAVTLYLHLAAAPPPGSTDRDEPWVGNVARWEGEGPVTTQYLRDVLGPLCRFTVKPVIDLDMQVSVNAYEAPEWMRERVHLVTGGDIYPYASSTRRDLDLDHVEPFVPLAEGGPPGQTHPGNLGPLTRFHHRLKTHGGWQARQPFPGIYLWRAPHGSVFLVDHTGTRKVTEPWSAEPTASETRTERSTRQRSRAEYHFSELVLAS